MAYYAIYVERWSGSWDDYEYDNRECLLGAEMTLEELGRSFPSVLWGTSRNDAVYVLDETDRENPELVPRHLYYKEK